MNAFLVFSFLIAPLSPGPQELARFRQWSKSRSPELRIQAVRMLRGQAGPESRAALLSMLSDAHPAVRAAVRDELVRRPDAEAALLAKEIARLRAATARVEGLRVLLARGDDPTPLAQDPDPGIRARALASGRVHEGVARAALSDRDPRVRALAIEAVRSHAAEAARDRAIEPRIAAARVLDDPHALRPLLRDPSWRVRLAALLATERLRNPELIPGLIDLLGAEKPGRVRARTLGTLEGLTGAAFGSDAKRWRAWWERVAAHYQLPPVRKSRGPGHSFARITFGHIPVVSRRICFVLDASRSMSKPAPGKSGKTRWQLVLRDLFGVLEKLPADSRFNVILFRTEVEAWKPRLVAATRAARRRCRDWIGRAEPEGWTNLYDAVALALADDAVEVLYVLTDGVPSRGTQTGRSAILNEIAYLNHYRLVQINCVQAGASEGLSKQWRGFLEELATAHDGVSVRE